MRSHPTLPFKVDDYGNVYGRSGKLIAGTPQQAGYLRCSYRMPGSRKTLTALLHRIIAECLLPNPEGKEQVNHKDGDKANNSPTNLEWATQSENMLHAWATGLNYSSDRHKEAGRNNLSTIAKTYPRDSGGRCKCKD